MIKEPLLTSGTGWRERAACLNHPAVLFFGMDDSESSAERRSREERAKRICLGCEVKEECLEYALSTREPYGIWGGLTEIERRARLHHRNR
jgi:WhiB family transcriptional regulator, redox-sensing transcriptional regulator